MESASESRFDEDLLEDEEKEREEEEEEEEEAESEAEVKDEDDEGETQKIQVTQGPIEISDKFLCLVLDRDTTTLVTTLNRVNSYRTIVFMANSHGIIGYGRGKGEDYKVALYKAINNCKKNMIAIPIDPHLSVPQHIHQRFQDYDVTLRPLRVFNPYGHPVFATMLSIAGLDHCGFKTVHTGKNNYGLLNAFFKVATKNKTPEQLAEKHGFKVYRHQWVKPLNREFAHKSIRE